MKKYDCEQLIKAGYEIKNAIIESVDLSMANHGCLTLVMDVRGDGWGVTYGDFCLGYGYLGADDNLFRGKAAGIEYLMRIMDTIGVSRFQDLKGKYIRVAIKGIGSIVKIIGNIIEDRWFDAESFFVDKGED